MAIGDPLWLVLPPLVTFAIVTVAHHYPDLPSVSLPTGRATAGRPAGGRGAAVEDDGREHVSCAACGADNEAGYRYCAACTRRLL
jgi:hypothetical protein